MNRLLTNVAARYNKLVNTDAQGRSQRDLLSLVAGYTHVRPIVREGRLSPYPKKYSALKPFSSDTIGHNWSLKTGGFK